MLPYRLSLFVAQLVRLRCNVWLRYSLAYHEDNFKREMRWETLPDYENADKQMWERTVGVYYVYVYYFMIIYTIVSAAGCPGNAAITAVLQIRY
jgi:hypothetical protein